MFLLVLCYWLRSPTWWWMDEMITGILIHSQNQKANFYTLPLSMNFAEVFYCDPLYHVKEKYLLFLFCYSIFSLLNVEFYQHFFSNCKNNPVLHFYYCCQLLQFARVKPPLHSWHWRLSDPLQHCWILTCYCFRAF